ncbi:MAG: glucosaminidase domain-containing protein, partial [Tenacibaculum sp.]
MKLKSILFFSVVSLLLASCGSNKKVVKRTTPKVVIAEPTPQKLPSVKQAQHVKKLKKKKPYLNKHTLNYIKKYAPIAVREMHRYKIPASITLAQGILESGSGRGHLASKSNNHFGIKCHTSWKGARVYHDDDAKGECFRKYQYVATSYKDHSLFLKNRSRYRFLFNLRTTDYKGWARGLKKAGYATDRKYPKKLIRIIQDYKLHDFDKFKKKDWKKMQNDKEETPVKIEKSVGNYYTVKKGD